MSASDQRVQVLDPNTPPPPIVDSIRALFADGAGAATGNGDAFLERSALLDGGTPAQWEGIAFPIELGVELAAVCNLKCVMCPVPTTSRPAELMDPELFRKTVEQLVGEKGFILLPQGFGESMLHPRWAELVGQAVTLGVRPIVMLTNGTVLNQRNIERVLELDIDALVISIDGVTPETYASVRVGGELERVEANVRNLIAQRGAAQRPRVCLRIIRMQDTANEIDAFFERWGPLLHPSDEIRINEYNDWAGKVGDRSVDGHAAGPAGDAGDAARGPCRMLWRNLSVHADGKVSACCHDSEDELIVGDLRKGESLQQIWRGEPLARLRRQHCEGRLDELPICKACKAWY